MDAVDLDRIQKTPGTCGGDARIRGTRIPVWAIVSTLRLGVTEEELQEYFGTPLTAEEIQAALAYNQAHRDEIEANIKENDDDE